MDWVTGLTLWCVLMRKEKSNFLVRVSVTDEAQHCSFGTLRCFAVWCETSCAAAVFSDVPQYSHHASLHRCHAAHDEHGHFRCNADFTIKPHWAHFRIQVKSFFKYNLNHWLYMKGFMSLPSSYLSEWCLSKWSKWNWSVGSEKAHDWK